MTMVCKPYMMRCFVVLFYFNDLGRVRLLDHLIWYPKPVSRYSQLLASFAFALDFEPDVT